MALDPRLTPGIADTLKHPLGPIVTARPGSDSLEGSSGHPKASFRPWGRASSTRRILRSGSRPVAEVGVEGDLGLLAEQCE